MWDFDGDELIFFIVAGIATVFFGIRWYLTLGQVSSLCSSRRSRLLLGITPPAALFILWIIIQLGADPVYVAGHFDYTLLFLFGGATWIFLATSAFPVLGLSLHDDAVDRNNSAAVVAICGAVFGVMFSYAGSNIGNGPTIWTTLVPAFVATMTLLVLWGFLAWVGGARDAITIDRDMAAAIRLAAFLICAGMILGRAMAGDFSDWGETMVEFIAMGWPVIMLLLFAAACNRIFAATPQRIEPPVILFGLFPAAFMGFMTLVYLALVGLPEVAPPGSYSP